MSKLEIQLGLSHPFNVYLVLNVSEIENVFVNQTVVSNTNDHRNETVFFPLVKQPVYMLVVLSIMYGAVFFCAVIGNITVLCVVLKDRRFHSATYYLIANLSLADLLMALICQPITLSLNIFNG
ncbi:unnamed protein product, partial [Candidula unifasciata]